MLVQRFTRRKPCESRPAVAGFLNFVRFEPGGQPRLAGCLPIHHRAFRQPPCQIRQHVLEQAGAKRRVEKYQIPGSRVVFEESLRVRGDHFQTIVAQKRCVVAQRLGRNAVFLHEHRVQSAPGCGLEAQGTAAGEQVQAPLPCQIAAQPVEQGLAGSAQSGPKLRPIGEPELSPLPLTADNAQLISGHVTIVSEGEDKNEGGEGKQGGFWKRLRSGLSKTRDALGTGVGNLLLGEKEINDEVLEDLETALLLTDVGVDATSDIMEDLAERVKRRELNNTRALHGALGRLLADRLASHVKPFQIDRGKRPFVIFMVGVNGVGKTTTIGKLAKHLQNDGLKVMLAAGDTFRAAAVEQLQAWGERNNVPVVAQGQGADSASVIYDAVQAAASRDVDVLLADTAGRLQAKTNLMEELRKIRRVVSRFDEHAPHETLLVLDAGVGQNALSQVREFNEAVPLSGLVVTKLDGTAKAGVLFAIGQQTDLPIYFIGVGEGIEDLRPFEAQPFVDALLADAMEGEE